ncbi:MAG: hypothetical protein ACO1RX_23040 [Candidatus Sericytochromatia bacterium]
MYSRFLLALGLVTCVLLPVQAQTEPLPEANEPSLWADWNLTLWGRAKLPQTSSSDDTISSRSRLGGALRVGKTFTPQFEGGFFLGGVWEENVTQGNFPVYEQQMPAGSDIAISVPKLDANGQPVRENTTQRSSQQRLNLGVDMRWYLLPTDTHRFQPFVTSGVELLTRSSWFPGVNLFAGPGFNWYFTEQLGLTAQMIVDTDNLAVDTSLGLRYQF